jgi:hypothetical protein
MSEIPKDSIFRQAFGEPHKVAVEDELAADNAALQRKNRDLSDRVAQLQKTLNSLVAGIEIVRARAAKNQSQAAGVKQEMNPSHRQVYELAASLSKSNPVLMCSNGKHIQQLVLAEMGDHFHKMVGHAQIKWPHCEPATLKRHILANLLLWVFAIQVDPESDSFSKRKEGVSEADEPAQILHASLKLRVLITARTFPVALMMTFIREWNSFSQQQLGMPGLAIDSKLGLSMPMDAVDVQPHIVSECTVKKNKFHPTYGYIRMEPVDKAVLLNKLAPKMRRSSPPPPSRTSYAAVTRAAVTRPPAPSSAAAAPAAAAAAAELSATASSPSPLSLDAPAASQ